LLPIDPATSRAQNTIEAATTFPTTLIFVIDLEDRESTRSKHAADRVGDCRQVIE